MVKKLIVGLIFLLLLTSCSLAAAKPLTQTLEPTPPQTTRSPVYTQYPGNTTPPGPTDVFITQVMATKYAARTQYAAIPTATSTPTIPTSSSDCEPQDLQTNFVPGAGGQHIDIFINVTNISNSDCFVPAWPAAKLLDSTGNPVAVSYDYIVYNTPPLSLPPTQVGHPGETALYGLKVGQTAQFFLSWGNWCQDAIMGGVTIRIPLLGSDAWVDVPTNIEGGGHCDYTNSGSMVDIYGFEY